MVMATRPNEVDRKLHRIVLESNPTEFASMITLAHHIEDLKLIEFSYSRGGKTQYSNAYTIRQYISFAQTIGLLDNDLETARTKKDIRSLENFQQWLSDVAVQFAIDRNCSIDQIRGAVQTLLQSSPSRLPTLENVRSRLTDPPDLDTFKLSAKIISLLRPNTFQIRARRVLLAPGIVEA